MADYIEILSNFSKLDNSEYLKMISLARKLSIKDMVCNDMRIAVVGSYSTQIIANVIRAKLLCSNIKAEIFEAEYNSLISQTLDFNSKLYEFRPDYIIILPYYKDITSYPGLLASVDEVNDMVANSVDFYCNIWKKIAEQLPKCNIIQSNFVTPLEYELGTLEANAYYSKMNYYNLINMDMIKRHPSNVTIIDFDRIASCIGKYKWFDESAYVLNKTGFSLEYVGYAVDIMIAPIKINRGFIRKCLVLDLDNTLWGGVLADEGVDGIDLDINSAVGEAFLNFQNYVFQLKNRGVILAVCSKNDYEIAKEPFLNNSKMILRYDDISCFVANWNNKADNLRFIATTLNIGMDSLVFFDDNPMERDIVREYLPEVLVIDVPEDPAMYVRALSVADPFDIIDLTEVDLNRNKSYNLQKKLNEVQKNFVDYNEYLDSLEMEMTCEVTDRVRLARFLQLTNKSNQFNLCTKRYTESQVNNMYESNGYILLSVALSDKFCNYSDIAAIVLKIDGNICVIENWVMSCRVLKRGVEDFTFSEMANIARKNGCNVIRGEYIQTPKNKMVENLYEMLKFQKIGENIFEYKL